MSTTSTTTQNLQALADALISTDRQSARNDVLMMGIDAAQKHYAEIAALQSHYSELARTADGWQSIRSALQSSLIGIPVAVKGEVGAIERIDGDGALVLLESGEVIPAALKDLELMD